MNNFILQISVLSIVCGFITSFVPDGGTKHITQMLSTAILLCAVLQPLGRFNLESTDFWSTKINELESDFAEKNEVVCDSLNKIGIEEQCREYILDKARLKSLIDIDVSIELKESDEGVYVPWSVELYGSFSDRHKREMSELILRDLGIPEERQMWING